MKKNTTEQTIRDLTIENEYQHFLIQSVRKIAITSFIVLVILVFTWVYATMVNQNKMFNLTNKLVDTNGESSKSIKGVVEKVLPEILSKLQRSQDDTRNSLSSAFTTLFGSILSIATGYASGLMQVLTYVKKSKDTVDNKVKSAMGDTEHTDISDDTPRLCDKCLK